MELALGHLNLIQATYVYQSLARIGHQLSKLSDIPGPLEVKSLFYGEAEGTCLP